MQNEGTTSSGGPVVRRGEPPERLEDLGLTHPQWEGARRHVSVSDVADIIMETAEEQFDGDMQFIQPRQSEDDDIVIVFTADHYVRIKFYDEDTDPVNGPAPEPFDEDNFVEVGPPEDADSGKTFTEDDQGNWHEVSGEIHGTLTEEGVVLLTRMMEAASIQPPGIIEIDPVYLQPGDLVVKVENRDPREGDDNCHCDIRVTVRRGANMHEPPF